MVLVVVVVAAVEYFSGSFKLLLLLLLFLKTSSGLSSSKIVLLQEYAFESAIRRVTPRDRWCGKGPPALLLLYCCVALRVGQACKSWLQDAVGRVCWNKRLEKATCCRHTVVLILLI